MKLHLPKGLRSAVLACMAVVGGFATTIATGVVTTGALTIAFTTPQAQAAVDYSVYAATNYVDQMYQWTGSNNGLITSNSYYKVSYDVATKLLVKNVDTAYTGWSNYQFNKVVVFDAASTTGTYEGLASYAWDHGGYEVRGIVVKSDASSNYLVGNKTDAKRALIIGDSNKESHSIFEKTFTIKTRGVANSYIETIGTQTWQVADGCKLTLISQKDIEQNGNLSLSGGTVEMSTKLALGVSSVTTVNAGTQLTLAGFSTTATAAFINNGTVDVSGNITLTGQVHEYAEKQAVSKTYSLGNENGYLSLNGDAQHWIIQGTGTVTLASGVTITDADGNTYAAQQDAGKGLYFNVSYNEDTEDFYITNGEVAVDMGATAAGESGAAASYVLNGGTMELSGGTLTGDKVRTFKDSTINIAATGELTRLTNVDHTVTLTGSGTYDMGNSVTVNVAGLTDSAWKGTVALGGGSSALTVTDFSFNTYGNAASAVEVSGVSGWLKTGQTYNCRVIFTQNDNLGYAMLVNNGGSGSTQTFAGAVSGDGTLKITYPGGTLNNMHFNFAGDVSGWTSEDGALTPEIHVGVPGKTVYVDFSGGATEINADTYIHQGTLNLSVTNDKGVTLNGALTHQGGNQSVFNVTIANSADTTFYNTVNVSTLTNNGAGAIVVGSKEVDGVQKVGSLVVTGSGSLGALTLDGGTAEVAGTSSISTLSVLAESATPALTAKGTLSLTNVAVDCTGWTGISLDKVYTLATVAGGSLNWADTTKQSVSGIAGNLGLEGQVSLNDVGELLLSFSKKSLSDTAYWDAAADKKWSELAWKESEAADATSGYITSGADAIFSGAGSVSTPEAVVVDTVAEVSDMTVSEGNYTFSAATSGGSLTVEDTLSIGKNGSATLDMETTAKNVKLTDSTASLTINKALTISEGGKVTATVGGTITNGLANDQPLVLEGASLGGVATKEGDVVSGNGLKLVGKNFTLDDVTLTGQINNTNADSIQLGGNVILDIVAMGDLVEGKVITYYDQTGVTPVTGVDNGYQKESLRANLFTKSAGVTAGPMGIDWQMKDDLGMLSQALVTPEEQQDGSLVFNISSLEAGTAYVAADADTAAVYDATNPLFSERATGLVLNGGDFILQTGLDKSAESKLVDGILAEQDGTVTICDDVTLDSSDVTTEVGATVTLLGGGTYDLGAATDLNSGVELGAAVDWAGTVKTAATAVTDLSALGNETSTVDLTGDVVTTALSTGTVGTVKAKSLTADTLSAGASTLSVAGAATLKKGASTVGDATFTGGLTLGSGAAATLTAGELSLSKLTVGHADSSLTATALSNSTLDIRLTDGVTDNLSVGDTRTLVTLTADDSLATLSLNGEADCTMGEYAAKYYYTIRWEEAAVVLTTTRNENYVKEKIEATTSNGEAGADIIQEMYNSLDPQANRVEYADLAKIMDAVDAGAVTDETAAAIAGSSISALGMALSGDVERQLRAIRNRTTSMGVNECVVNEGMPYFNAWFNAEGNRGKLSEDGTAPGYTLDSWGGTVGFDVDVNPNLSMGLAITAMYGDFTAEGPDALEGDMDTYYLSLFARYADCAWTHTFVATVGMMDGSVERTVPGMYGTDSSIDGTTFGLMYEVGYVIPLDEDGEACVQPIFNVMLRHASVGSMTEEGSDAGLEVGKQSMTTLTFGLGARLQAVVGESLYNRASIFEARVLAKADVGDRRSEADVGFPYGGPRATVQSAELGAIGLEVGAGLTIPLGDDDGSIFFDASLELRSGYTNVNGTVGYRINF